MTAPLLHIPTGPIGDVLSRLVKVAKNATGWIARCPAHEDGRPSLSVSVGADGGVLLFCHAGCSTDSIVSAINLSLRDLFPTRTDRPVTAGSSSIVATYDYHDAAGALRYQVVRMAPKDFRQRRPDPSGDWIWSMKGVDRLLYRLPEVLAARADGRRAIFLVEGEKDADSLRALGFVATTNTGGAKKWQSSYTDALRGARVVVVPDSDKAGWEHRDLVTAELHGVAAELRVLEVPAPHKDITNWIDAGGTAEQLKELVRATPIYAPAALSVTLTDGAVPDIAPPPGAVPPPPPPPGSSDKPKKYAKSDTGNAERMIARHGADLRFVKNWKSWLVWDGARWTRDETFEATRRAIDSVRSMYDELRGTLVNSEERAEIAKFVIKSEGEPRLRGMLALAQAIDGVAIEPRQLDADHFLFNVRNGTLDLRSGQLRPHERTDLITKMSPVVYDAEASCPVWLAFLDRIMDGKEDLVRYLQMAIGYALTGSTSEQCFFFCYGTGANGKTTLLETLLSLLGDYATQTDFSTFVEKKNEGPRNDIAALFGARMVTSSEGSEGKRLDEAMLKSLTGSETVSARFLYADLFKFKPTFKLFLAANHKPVIRGTDEGIWRRVRLIPFTVQIPPSERDADLLEKLRAELPGILTWAVEGCQLWLEHGRLPTPADVTAAVEQYRVESDTLGVFLTDHCELGPEFAEPATPLYNAYKAWAVAGNEWALTQSKFGKSLENRGIYVEKRPGGLKWRVGVRLLPHLNTSESRDTSGSSRDAEERFF